jgi:hypothetical protein
MMEWTHRILADVYIERGPDSEQAERHLRWAKRRLKQVKDNPKQKEAWYYDSRGWLNFRVGRAADALKHLERAACLWSDPENHYHLAVVCLDRAEACPEERVRWLRRTREHREQALASDLRDALTRRLEAIEKRAAELAALPSPSTAK